MLSAILKHFRALVANRLIVRVLEFVGEFKCITSSQSASVLNFAKPPGSAVGKVHIAEHCHQGSNDLHGLVQSNGQQLRCFASVFRCCPPITSIQEPHSPDFEYAYCWNGANTCIARLASISPASTSIGLNRPFLRVVSTVRC